MSDEKNKQLAKSLYLDVKKVVNTNDKTYLQISKHICELVDEYKLKEG